MTEERKRRTARIKCVIFKEVTLKECTLSEAYSNPWEYAEDELETDMYDWEVRDVKDE